MQPLDDDQLKQLLAQWKAPGAPASLEAHLSAARHRPAWRWFLQGKIEVPVPVGALAIALLVTLGLFALRGGPTPPPNPAAQASQFRLVDDLNPQIIRSSYDND
jgi:hypothetical protein